MVYVGTPPSINTHGYGEKGAEFEHKQDSAFKVQVKDDINMGALTEGLPTESAKIRALDAAGVARADIARFLDIRYQHVRYVLLNPPKKLAKDDIKKMISIWGR